MTTPESDAVRATFAGIASRYDVTNLLLSGGLDFLWRRRLILAAKALVPPKVLDLATGSGDVALKLRNELPSEVDVTGLDFCLPMLREAERKRDIAGHSQESLQFLEGDCLNLPFDDESFDLLTIAFGLRNLVDRPRGLAEMLRVLRPGGSLLVLEFSQPYFWLKPLYYLYLRGVLPVLACLATGDRKAYEYLVASIAGFPARSCLADELIQAGFTDAVVTSMTGAIVVMHAAEK